MLLYIKNSSSDTFTYASGTVSATAGATISVASDYWYPLFMDINFLKDIRLNNILLSDGLKDYSDPDSEAYINKLISINSKNKDVDGTEMTRMKITTLGWSFQRHGFEIESSQLDSVYSKKYDQTDLGFVTLKCYNSEGVQLTVQEDADLYAVKTVVDWEPTFDYEVVGGELKQKSIPSEDVRAWVVGVPDVAAVYGGSKEFIVNANLAYIGLEQGMRSDGRTAKLLKYNATYHTNKLRMILIHPAGFKHKLHMMFEIFKL